MCLGERRLGTRRGVELSGQMEHSRGSPDDVGSHGFDYGLDDPYPDDRTVIVAPPPPPPEQPLRLSSEVASGRMVLEHNPRP